MRSMIYRLSRKLSVELRDLIVKRDIGTEFFARLTLDDGREPRVAHVSCGTFSPSWGWSDEPAAQARANARLERFLAQMADLGVVVKGAENRFAHRQAGRTGPGLRPMSVPFAAVNPYQRFRSSELILRDQLAIDRTILANERTLLSYIRTGLALALTGAGGIKYLDSLHMTVLGYCLVVLDVFVGLLGAYRFVLVQDRIRTVGTNRPGGYVQGKG